MNENDEIEELDDEYAEVEPDVHFDLSWWKDKHCKR